MDAQRIRIRITVTCPALTQLAHLSEVLDALR